MLLIAEMSSLADRSRWLRGGMILLVLAIAATFVTHVAVGALPVDEQIAQNLRLLGELDPESPRTNLMSLAGVVTLTAANFLLNLGRRSP